MKCVFLWLFIWTQDAHRAVLETLAPYSEYAVEVAAVSKAGQGPSARLEFSTPALPTLTTRGYGKWGWMSDDVMIVNAITSLTDLLKALSVEV